MNKFIRYVALFLCCIAGSTSYADHWVNTKEALLSDAAQISDNCAWNSGCPSSNMLDDKPATYFHSRIDQVLENTDLYWTVDLQKTDISAFYFYMKGRGDGEASGNAWHDTPDHIIIKATNTPDDDNSWTQVADLDLEGKIPNDHNAIYNSDAVLMNQNYQFVRFIVKHTTSGANYFNLDAFQMYVAKHLTNSHDNLSFYVDSIKSLQRNYIVGTTPGYYDEPAVKAFQDALEAASNTSNDNTLSDAEYQTAIDNLTSTFTKVEDSWIRPTTGYYRLRTADDEFSEKDFIKGMFVNSLGELTWGDIDKTSANFLFKLESQTDGTWTIYNPSQRKYINTVSGNAATKLVYVATSNDATTPQIISHFGAGNYSFKISNKANTLAYNMLGSDGGAGASGRIGPLEGIAASAASWKLEPVDESEATALIDAAEKDYYKTLLQNAVDDGLRLRSKVVDLTPYITSADQISLNEGGNLIDNDHSTYFNGDGGIDWNTADVNIDVDLEEPTNNFTLEYFGRNDQPESASEHDTPNKFDLSVSKDGTNWTKVGSYNITSLTNANNAHYISPAINLSDSYQFVRFSIKGVTSGKDNWNLSEFQIYKNTMKASSEYILVPGMQDAVGNLDAAVTAALNKIASSELVTKEDTAAFNAAIAPVKKLYVDKDALNKTLTDNLTAATVVYNKAFVYDNLLTEAYNDAETSNLGQITGNGTFFENAPQLGYACLIDGKTNDMSGFFHSSLTAIPDNKYLQFDLRQKVEKINFWMDAATIYNTAFPSVIDIYASNTPTDESSWKLIKTVNNPNSPATPTNRHFDSPNIELGDNYQYLRFYVRDNGYHNPASIGYFMIDEMQIRNLQANPATSQYYYMDGVKTAADNLMTLIDAIRAKMATGMVVNLNDTIDLNQAVKTLQAAFYDPQEIKDLLATAKKLISNATTGEELGQISQDVFDQIQSSVLETEAGLDFDKINKSVMDAAKISLTNAINTFYENLNTVEAGKWYYILNQAPDGLNGGMDMSSEFAQAGPIRNSALFIRNNALAPQLRWGLMNDAYVGDVRAIWHFIPVPGMAKGYFYIQNLRSGMYLGQINTVSGDYYSQTTSTPMIMHLEPGTSSSFHITPADPTSNDFRPLGAGDNANQVRTDEDATRTMWTFKEVDPELTTVKMGFANNNIRINTLPFAVSNLSTLNANVYTYAIKSIPNENTLRLVKKDEFKAGEPFVLLIGDTTKFATDHNNIDLTVSLPDHNYSLAIDTVNGLISVPTSYKIIKAGYGYFSNARLKATTGTALTIGFQGGYIDGNRIATPADDQFDLEIITVSGSIINAVKPIISKDPNLVVNIYTLDGKLLKRNVKSSEALKGLSKGIYIVGKKKVALK